ncbi:MAG UNVERIFIED_CONTAM: hypothetical protein LVR18_07655 [Planctomycetaceae bacterium]
MGRISANLRTQNADPSTLPSQVPLSAWQQCTGDHGWAGYVAEQLLQQPQPLHVIFAPGTSTLDLVREVLDLLPPARRWEITFSTYFTRLPAGVDCRLRFVLDETPEATTLRHDARSHVLDLTQPLPPAQGGQLVVAARTGVVQTAPPGYSQAPNPTSTQPAAAAAKLPPLAAALWIPRQSPALPQVTHARSSPNSPHNRSLHSTQHRHRPGNAHHRCF